MIDRQARGRQVSAWVCALVTTQVLALLACSSPQAGRSSPRQEPQAGAASASTSRRCVSDAECGSSFCDRGACAVPSEIYGQPCQPAPRTAAGLRDGKLSQCGAYVCSSGRCRSCSSNEECQSELGSPKCYAASGRPGLRCGDPP